MQIRLQNVGIIGDSTLALDGLTVITGKNNSGKTTVGKVLYSLIDSISDIQQKAKKDRYDYVGNKLESLENVLEIFRYLRFAFATGGADVFAGSPALGELFRREYSKDFPEDIEQFARDIYEELVSFDGSVFDTNDKNYNEKNYGIYRYQKLIQARSKNETLALSELFEKQRARALAEMEELFTDLKKDPQLIDYARECINQTLRVEFSNQVQPISSPDVVSRVELSSGESVFFDFTIKNNKVLNNGMPVFLSSPFRRAYLIDDPFILDEISSKKFYFRSGIVETETILNPSRIQTHNQRLKSILRSEKKRSVFEQTVMEASLGPVEEKINDIIPGRFEFSNEGEYYVRNGTKLKMCNLATGSKMFSIIKMLFEKGEIDDTTMLILDEPEAHLHPAWQNAFAEIIVLMVKELGVNVLLTTHGSNFMLAIDAYMRKHNIAEKSNFYQTEASEGGFVHYRCVNDDMERIYQDFLEYLSEVKALRDRCMLGFEE